MSQYWNYPRLKRGVDLQLQTAYNDGDWQRVARLAAKRATISDKQYHEILKSVAESQLDSPAFRYAVIVLCRKMVKEETIIRDVESFDLLDWAVGDPSEPGFLREVMGPLRLRAVKSGKLNRVAMVKCFEACLRTWDLESAQQIAAFMDRTFKQERVFMFWNIAVTFLLASSDQCAKDKKLLYSTLASRMALKANQDTANAPKNPALQEEEVLVYYRILSAQGTLRDWQSLLNDDNLGPLAQCCLGRKDPFIIALGALEKLEDWASIYVLTKAGMTTTGSTEEDIKPSVLASDWVLWQYYLRSAGKLRESNPNITKEATILIEVSSLENAAAIHRRTMILTKILACFELPTEESGARAVKLMSDMIQNMTTVARFEDLRPLVQRMTAAEQDTLLAAITKSNEKARPLEAVMKQALYGKIRFLIFTCRASTTDEFEDIIKTACVDLRSLTHPNKNNTLNGIADILKDLDLSESKPIKIELSPDFSILIAVSLVKLSELTTGKTHESKLQYLLQAISILENQLHITPKDHSVLMLLVRLHTLIGAAWRARETWDVLDVKRTIVDSLAPLFLDRLASVAPALVSGDKITKNVISYYDNVFKTEMPKSLVEAIHAKSYASIVQIAEYIETLRTSSTRAMGYLEKQKAARAFDGKAKKWTMPDSAVYAETINYGPFPTLESTSSIPIYDTLSIGSKPSNTRTQLSVLGEKFFSILNTKPPSLYKPLPAAIAADEVYVREELTRLANSFTHYLSGNFAAKLTASEFIHYQLLALLTLFILNSTPLGTETATSTKANVEAIVASLSHLISIIDTRLSSTPDSTLKALRFFSSLHDLWYIRDTASAIRLSLNYITAFNGRQKPPKPSAKEFSASLKALETVSAEASVKGKGWIAAAKRTVAESGFERKVVSVAFDEGEIAEVVSGAADIEGTSAATWGKKIVDSWKLNIKGWENVRWD